MWQKLKPILGSVRFWIITLTAVIAVLNGTPLLDVLQVWGGVIAGVGTFDKAMLALGGKA